MRLRNKKTGEIVERSSIVTLRCKISSSSSSLVEAEEFGSIKQLTEEWEDYKPIEPEIADQTARETIRKWYNKNRIVGKLYSYGGESWLGLRGDDKSGCSWKIELHVDYFSKLISDKLYSLNELRGENEDSEHELDSEEKRANEY